MVDKLHTFIDRFDNAGFSNAKWYNGSEDDIEFVNGRCEIVAGSGYPGLISATAYDMVGSSFHVEVVQAPNAGLGSTSAEIGVRVGTDNGDKVVFVIYGGSSLQMVEKVGGADSITSVAYDPVAHRWLRVREAGGTIHWECSENSSSWTVLRSKAKNVSLPSLASVQPVLNAGFWDAETDAGTAIYDNVNQWEVPIAERGWFLGRNGTGAIDGGTLFYRNFCQEAEWLWSPIPDDPELDHDSDAIVADMTTGDYLANVSMYAFGCTLVSPEHILSDTPRYTVLLDNDPEWGSPLAGYEVPIPYGTQIPPGVPPSEGVADPNYDGHISIADPVQGKIFSLWRARYDDETDTWAAEFGGIADYQGDGIEYEGSSTATCLTRYAAVLRGQELEAREIPHALFLATNTSKPTTFRYPAAKTDGTNAAGVDNPIEQGSRVQLDPSIDVAAIPGITPGEIAVGRALQKFGAYIGDKNDTTAHVSFGLITEFLGDGTNPGKKFVDAGFAYDFFEMSHIPWESLRVLRDWQGSHWPAVYPGTDLFPSTDLYPGGG